MFTPAGYISLERHIGTEPVVGIRSAVLTSANLPAFLQMVETYKSHSGTRFEESTYQFFKMAATQMAPMTTHAEASAFFQVPPSGGAAPAPEG